MLPTFLHYFSAVKTVFFYGIFFCDNNKDSVQIVNLKRWNFINKSSTLVFP